MAYESILQRKKDRNNSLNLIPLYLLTVDFTGFVPTVGRLLLLKIFILRVAVVIIASFLSTPFFYPNQN
jgi:hypothetical protein